MATKYHIYDLQLYDIHSGQIITTAGYAQVMTAGAPAKAAIYDADEFTAKTNVAAIPSGGNLKFATLNSIEAVDISVMLDTGHSVFLKQVTPGSKIPIPIDTRSIHQTLIVGMAVGDSDITANTEYNTGFVFATNQLVLPDPVVITDTLDATETIDFGILSSESGGDANGFGAAVSVGTAIAIPVGVTVTTGVVQASPTRGALLADHADGTNADDRGIHNPKSWRCNGTAKTLSATFSAGTDTAAVYLKIDTEVPANSDWLVNQ